MLFLSWLAIEITKKIQPPDIKIESPGWELLFGLLIVVLWEFAPFLPRINFGDKWDLGFILKKSLILVLLPLIFLKLRKHPFSSMGFTKTNWKKNLKVGFMIFLAMAIPSAFYSNTARLILSGKLSLSQIGIGFPVSFTYFLLMSGFSEEFLFRVFIQTRCSLLLKSKIGGVLISPLLFGLPHFSGIMWWYPGTKLVQAFCRAFFIQTFMGILLGILWERTRSLIPGVILHSGINGLNNLGWIVSRFGF